MQMENSEPDDGDDASASSFNRADALVTYNVPVALAGSLHSSGGQHSQHVDLD